MNTIVYDINSLFPVDSKLSKCYSNKLELGKKYAKDKKIVILCLARNIEQQCNYSLRQIRILLENFHKDSAVYIYENDSIDKTVEKITEIINRKGYEQFHLKTETLLTKSMPFSKSKTRTSNMAQARNKCYSLIQNPNTFDFSIVMDLDFLNLSIDGILNSFGWMKDRTDIKSMCGISVSEVPKGSQQYINYDSFAFRFNHWHMSNMSWFPYFMPIIGSEPFKVFSGFGGSCIYRSEYYKPLYGGEDCEHVILHQNITQIDSEFNVYCNPGQIMVLAD